MSTDPMAEIRASFFIECEELLENLQDALVVMDEGGADGETVNVVFRAVHSIKGGAGAFALDALVGFAHRFETVLDELRAGRIDLTPEAVRLFFQGADLLADHVRAARDDAPPPAGSESVLAALESLMGDTAKEEEVIDFTPSGLSFDLDFDFSDGDAAPLSADHPTDDVVALEAAPDAVGDTPLIWRIKITPHSALYTSGNDASHLLRSLSQLGKTQVTCHIPTLPAPSPDHAETAMLGWTVDLAGDASEAEIRDIFDFVSDICDLEISRVTPPALDAPPPIIEEAPIPKADTPTPDTPADTVAPDLSAAPQHEDTSGDAPPPNAAVTKPKPPEAAATVRVDIDKIDRLVNQVGELVINQAMLSQSVTEAGIPAHSPVMSGLEAFMLLTRDIQDSVMAIRAQPVKPLFQRMSRIVREASGMVGKTVRLRTEGDTTEVDKTVIERLADPLTHMVRNAVDHGLETPDQRLAAGKPAEGCVTLSASHRAGRVLIEIADDGAGINRPRVKEIAVSKGLIPADIPLSDTEIDNLLFLPGFSTASKVSNLSGRGVGMDVVKSAITALGGRISISSEPGVGTRFSISLPLTLAVLDGMIVRVAGQTLVVPLSSILETAKLAAEDIKQIGRNARLLHIRGTFVPLIDLGAELGFRTPDQDEGRIVLLTAQEDGRRAAFIVDAIMEQRQVVIKGLAQNYGHIRGIAAATILGDGQIALILDPADLVEKAGQTPANDDIAIAG